MCAKKRDLHPSVQAFKEFVREHPKLIIEVREGKRTWQALYEEWYLIGDNDAAWERISREGQGETQQDTKEEKKALGQIMSFFQNLDMDQVQGQLNNFNHVLGNLQQLVGIFTGSSPTNNDTPKAAKPNPFSFQKD
jgi:Putative coat protein